ncbi:transcriptional regulator domain-containing protein [Gymnodinialimonas sp.]
MRWHAIRTLAWECLRRNPEYRAQFSDMQRGLLPASDWGLRFRS